MINWYIASKPQIDRRDHLKNRLCLWKAVLSRVVAVNQAYQRHTLLSLSNPLPVRYSNDYINGYSFTIISGYTVLDEYHDFVEKEYHTKSLKVHCKSFNGMHFGLSLKILQRHAAWSAEFSICNRQQAIINCQSFKAPLQILQRHAPWYKDNSLAQSSTWNLSLIPCTFKELLQ
jgi:hypothetical protein